MNSKSKNPLAFLVLLEVLGWLSFAMIYLAFEVLTRHFGLNVPLLVPDAHDLGGLTFLILVIATIVSVLMLPLVYRTGSRGDDSFSRTMLLMFVFAFYFAYDLIVSGPGSFAAGHPQAAAAILIAAIGAAFICGVVAIYGMFSPWAALLLVLLCLVGSSVSVQLFSGAYGGCLGRETACLADRAARHSTLKYCALAKDPEDCTITALRSPLHKSGLCLSAFDDQSRTRCYLHFAALGGVSECERGVPEEAEAQCSRARVEHALAEDDCDSIDQSGLREDCVVEQQKTKPVLTACRQISKGERREHCIENVALAQHRPEFCRALKSVPQRENCLTEIVRTTGNYAPCGWLRGEKQAACHSVVNGKPTLYIPRDIPLEEYVDGVVDYSLYLRCTEMAELESCESIMNVLRASHADVSVIAQYSAAMSRALVR